MLKNILMLHKYLFSLILLIAPCLMAKTWNDLDVGDLYLSRIKIENPQLVIIENQKFELVSLNADNDYFIHFLFFDQSCIDLEKESELILAELENNSVIGLKLENNCLLSIYIEPYQFYDESLFK